MTRTHCLRYSFWWRRLIDMMDCTTIVFPLKCVAHVLLHICWVPFNPCRAELILGNMYMWSPVNIEICSTRNNDDVIKCKLFPRGVQRWPSNSLYQGLLRGRSFDVFFDLHMNQRLSKMSRRRWFDTPSRPLMGKVILFDVLHLA